MKNVIDNDHTEIVLQKGGSLGYQTFILVQATLEDLIEMLRRLARRDYPKSPLRIKIEGLDAFELLEEYPPMKPKKKMEAMIIKAFNKASRTEREAIWKIWQEQHDIGE